MSTERYFIPGARPWSQRDEIAQRLGNCRSMLKLAWAALSTDSFDFAVALVNSVRTAGDGVITHARKRGVRMDGDAVQ